MHRILHTWYNTFEIRSMKVSGGCSILVYIATLVLSAHETQMYWEEQNNQMQKFLCGKLAKCKQKLHCLHSYTYLSQ